MADLIGIIGLGTGAAFGVGGLMSFLKGKQLMADANRVRSRKSAKESESEVKLRDLEQQFATRETSFRQELDETGRRLKEADQRAEALTQDLATQVARMGSLESLQNTLDEQKKQHEAEKLKLSTALEAALAQGSGGNPEEVSTLREQLEETRSKLKDIEAKSADTEAQLLKAETQAEQRLSKLTQMSEKLALELKQTKDALAAAESNTGSSDPASSSSLSGSDVFLSAIVESSYDAVCVMDEHGKIITWNRAAEGIYGYDSASALGMDASLLVAHDSRDSFQKAINLLEGSQRPRALDIYGVRQDGSAFPVEVVLATWQDDATGEKRSVVVTHDVSERRQAEAMRRDKEAAEEANRAKSQFLANMSHELRTPLNAIIGFSEILHDRTFGELTPKQERYVGNILSSGRHLLQLINDILDLSKIEAGRVQLEYAAFSPLTAVRTVDNLVKALLQKKNITLEVEGGTTLPPLIADQAKFKQVLYNLISNAIKFTPENGNVMVALSTVGNGTLLQVDVKDTGIGIKQEDQDRIFREFEQVDNSYSRQQQGTGLGLALVKKFIEMHGGRIWVSSGGEGKGSTFSFTVPFGPEDSGPSPERGRTTRTSKLESAASVSAKPMALVVESNAASAERLTYQLQEGGYDVARASNGKVALTLAQELKPTVITLEVELEGEDGWEVLRQLKADEALKSIPVVVVSETKDSERARELGAAELVAKPVEAETLLRTLTNVRQEPSSQEAPVARLRRGRSERAAA
ncbi:ATP-binding protein [Armatimonas sp.]|uniref:hybrid sensor histidine kinase/response regulator n=1 Tax=Armatimonas sp. TaxID=1872638 RepID=UPI00286AFDDF|nr:ATP-binding protein [Armatimonas sp.]